MYSDFSCLGSFLKRYFVQRIGRLDNESTGTKLLQIYFSNPLFVLVDECRMFIPLKTVLLILGGIRGVVDVSTFESGELFFDMLDLDEIAFGFPDLDFFLAGALSLAFDEGDFS